MARIRWKSVVGGELLEAGKGATTLDDLLDDCQAVYLWRRRIVAPRHVASNSHQLSQWLDRALAVPYSLVGPSQITHYITSRGFAIGGGPLSVAKQVTLKPISVDPSLRVMLGEYVASLSDFTPPLYVGETGNVRRRVREHMNGETQFSQTLQLEIGLGFSDVVLYYLNLGPSTDGEEDKHASRTLLEAIACRLTLAGNVRRIG